ncbi:hypothetical protein A3A39_04545 [Candidatus Kaiserbacteria bacterium RIFCSPLOWO2_01_FULL_54_13]|uniref:Glycosyltransferase subfamily 4-like N-terminal domain-containing protein n=1 Tax=Candidatus Kaiserbacteria bacterium RIFCSPLOWO2_01_FULL_54_13 TaxID=1798512 RepID=A0A1F6F1M0_9BACT|nr:MAG: hypothetical protein A3A39_04545 [Candidatus Kaiserbacteria bacterium RIFCSPLOWO2_01_FULL_54_13]
MSLSPGSRILFVTDTWRPQINGVVTVIEHLKEEIERRGMVVDVLDPSQFLTVPFPLYTEFRLALFSWRNIRRRIKDGAYDEVNIHTYGPMAWYARAACIRLNKRFTMTFHNQIHLYAEVRFGTWARKLVEKLIYYFYSPAALTLVTTRSAQKQLLGFGLTRVSVWPLGVDKQFFTRGVCPRVFEKPVFVFLGRIAPEKNIEEFLSAELPGTKIVIGDGPDKKKLESQYPDVVFLGYQTRERLVSWMCCADVLVMPSRTDTFGLVIVEALALGIPVAAHSETGPKDIIHNGVNGYLDEDIVRAAKQCLSLSPDRCRDSVKNYTWSKSAETFLSVLQSARGTAP